jgi:hypothetical protein
MIRVHGADEITTKFQSAQQWLDVCIPHGFVEQFLVPIAIAFLIGRLTAMAQHIFECF